MSQHTRTRWATCVPVILLLFLGVGCEKQDNTSAAEGSGRPPFRNCDTESGIYYDPGRDACVDISGEDITRETQRERALVLTNYDSIHHLAEGEGASHDGSAPARVPFEINMSERVEYAALIPILEKLSPVDVILIRAHFPTVGSSLTYDLPEGTGVEDAPSVLIDVAASKAPGVTESALDRYRDAVDSGSFAVWLIHVKTTPEKMAMTWTEHWREIANVHPLVTDLDKVRPSLPPGRPNAWQR